MAARCTLAAAILPEFLTPRRKRSPQFAVLGVNHQEEYELSTIRKVGEATPRRCLVECCIADGIDQQVARRPR